MLQRDMNLFIQTIKNRSMTQQQAIQLLANNALFRKAQLQQEIHEIDLALQALQAPVEQPIQQNEQEVPLEAKYNVNDTNIGVEQEAK